MIVTIEEILSEAVEAGASDVHVTVGISPKMRVNGKLTPMSFPKLMPGDTVALLISILSEAQKEKFEQNGQLDISYALKDLGYFRVNAYKQKGCVALAIRVVGNEIPSADILGIPDNVMELAAKEQGLIVVSGPAGCGKSTTLACILDRINSDRQAHIITLEDPIEFIHQHKESIVNQREIGLDTGSFSVALKAALREDPDVIMISELRDEETISLAVTAAETGHLILAAIHAGSVAKALDSLLAAYPSYQHAQVRQRLENVLQAVICQKLISNPEGEGRVPKFEVICSDSKG